MCFRVVYLSADESCFTGHFLPGPPPYPNKLKISICRGGGGGGGEREREREQKYSHYKLYKLSNLQCVINTYNIIHIKIIQRKTIYIRYRHKNILKY